MVGDSIRSRVTHFIFNVFDALIPPSEEEQQVRTLTSCDLAVTPKSLYHGTGSVTALWSYRTPHVRSVIWALKYRRSRHAAELCAHALVEYITELTAESHVWQEERPVVLIPIPLAPKREKERGYNQITLCLQSVRAMLPHIRIEPTVLERTRETIPQTNLSRAKRLTNLRGAFRLAPGAIQRLKGAHVLLIDDVTTTGTTLREAARVLKKAKVDIECIALAHARE